MAVRSSKVQAWQVESGEAIELDWPLSAEATRLSIVLGPDGSRLDTNGPAPVGPVFIYSRKTLEVDTPEPAPLVIEVEEAAEPALPPRAEPHTNPMLAAYQAFEYQFTLHAAKAKSLRDAIERRREASGKLFTEAEAQLRGMRAAQANVEATHRELLTEYATFRETFAARHAAHAALLASFEDDMRRLLQARLHPALASPQRQTLLDCIPEARFRSWADTCRQEHEQLQIRVVELDALMRDLREAVEGDGQRNVVDMDPLRRMHTRSAETVKTAAAQSEVFERDLEAIRNTLRTSIAALQAARAFNWASCDGFSTMQKAHETQLLELNDANRLSKDTMAFFAQTKNRLRREVWHRLRTVASLQNRVRDAHNRLAVFRQALQRQSSACDQLLTLHEMPSAYFASLEEVHRRQRFSRQLTSALERVSARLDSARDGEIARREAFLERHGRFILKDLVPGLDETLPSFQLAAPRFDAALPILGPPPAHLEVESEALLLEPPSQRQAEAEAIALRHRVRELEERARALAATAGGVQHSTSAGLRGDKSGEEALAKAEKQRDEYVARIGALEAKLSRMYELNNQLQTRLSDTEMSAAHADPEAPLLRQRLAEAEATADRFKAALKQAHEHSASATSMATQATEALKAKTQECEDMSAQLQAQRAASMSLQKELKEAQLNKAEAQGEAEKLAAARKQLAEADARHKANQDELKSERANVRQLEEERKNLEALLMSLEQAVAESKEKLTEESLRNKKLLDAAMRTGDEQVKKTLAQAEAQVIEARHEVERLKSQAARDDLINKETQSKIAGRVNELEAALRARDDQSKHAQGELMQHKTKVQELNALLDASTKAKQKAEEWLTSTRDDLASAQKATAAVTTELNNVKAQLKQAEQRIEQASKDMKRFEMEAADLKIRCEVAERGVADSKSLGNAVLSALGALKIPVPRAQPPATDAQVLASCIAQLTNEVAEKFRAEEAARKRADAAGAAVKDAEARVQDLSRKVEELSSQVLVRTLELQDLKSQQRPGGAGNAPSPVVPKARDREAIALRDFEVGDIVMFWSNAQHVYEAYTYVRGGQRAAKYYLSEDSFPSFEKERAASLVIMGTVVSREQLKATGSDYTRLPAGEVYYELIVQRLD